MDDRFFFPATLRNRAPIGDVLMKILPKNGIVLEIASGSGEHGITFQKKFPNICWQTSDPDPSCRKSIKAWIDHEGLSGKMPMPLDLDVLKRPWQLSSEFKSSLRAIICINMIHISPWCCTKALFQEAETCLEKDQLLMLYGPFKISGEHISASNYNFDKTLRSQNSLWGVRDLDDISEIAKTHKLEMVEKIIMPANNLSVIFQR